MCDEFTARDDDARQAGGELTRREFARLGTGAAAGAALAGCMPAPAAQSGSPGPAEQMVAIRTSDGTADALFVHPSSGRRPGVILWPDIAGLRDAYKVTARRLAGAGYAVLAVNHYYRSAPSPIMNQLTEWRTPEGQAKIAPMREALTPAAIARDAAAFVAWLDTQSAVDTASGIGTMGYCMTGSYTIRTAAAAPQRVRAAASFHGGGLATDEPDSPHLLIPQTRADYLFAIAQNDDAREPDEKTQLRRAVDAAGLKAEIEVYPADHGWCALDAPSYDEPQAERAWSRLLALFSAAL